MQRWRSVALATIMAALLLPAPAHADVPSIEIDTDWDGKVELTIYDKDGDGRYEWPTGLRRFPGELALFDPVVMRGTVGITATDVSFYGGVTTDPAAPLTDLTMTARGGSINLENSNAVATHNVVLTADREVSIGGDNRLVAGNQLNITSLTSAVYGFNTSAAQVGTPEGGWTLTAGTRVSILAKGKEGSVDLVNIGIRSREIAIDTPNTSSEYRFFTLEDSVLTTDPVRAQLDDGRRDPHRGILLRSADRRATFIDTEITSGRSIALKTVIARSDVCVRGGLLSVPAAGAEISTSGIRGRFLVDPDRMPSIQGRIAGKKPLQSSDC